MTVVLASRSFQEAHEKKKTCDRKRYKADPESKKDSMKAQYWLDPESKKDSAKAQYWLDPESKKDSVKAYYDQNREQILASKQDQYQANPKAKRDISRINSCRKRNTMRYECLQCLGAICPTRRCIVSCACVRENE